MPGTEEALYSTPKVTKKEKKKRPEFQINANTTVDQANAEIRRVILERGTRNQEWKVSHCGVIPKPDFFTCQRKTILSCINCSEEELGQF